MEKRLIWCSKIKEGLKIVKPNEKLSDNYLNEAKKSLEKAKKSFIEEDFLWATVIIYYAEYYALYSFLQKIGIKCENHSCSILAAEFLLGTDNVSTIKLHKQKRIDAQYYIKTDKKEEIKKTINDANILINNFEEIIY